MTASQRAVCNSATTSAMAIATNIVAGSILAKCDVTSLTSKACKTTAINVSATAILITDLRIFRLTECDIAGSICRPAPQVDARAASEIDRTAEVAYPGPGDTRWLQSTRTLVRRAAAPRRPATRDAPDLQYRNTRA